MVTPMGRQMPAEPLPFQVDRASVCPCRSPWQPQGAAGRIPTQTRIVDSESAR